MLEPSSSEDEGGESTTTPYPADAYDDTSSAVSAISSQRDSGRQSAATNLSSLAGHHAYHSNSLHPAGHGQQRSITPCQDPGPSTSHANHHQHHHHQHHHHHQSLHSQQY